MTKTDEKGAPLVLVTGATGRIGSRLVAALEGQARTVGLDVEPPPDSWRGSDWFHCDLTEDESVEAALAKIAGKHGCRVESVVHLAAYYDFSGEESDLYEEVTVQGTRRLLRGLKNGLDQVGQFVFSSSLLVMDPVEPGRVLTEASATRGAWAYPDSKLKTEDLIRAERDRIPAVILRLAGIYDEGGHSIPLAHHIRRIREKKLESVFFPGDPDRGQPYVHVDDAVDAILKAIEGRSHLDPWEVFLIAEPDLLTHAELQDHLGRLLHDKAWPTLRVPAPVAKAGAWVKDKLKDDTFVKPWMIDLADAHRPVDIRRARERLGWNPQHRLRDELSRIVRNLKSDPERWYAENGLEVEARPGS